MMDDGYVSRSCWVTKRMDPDLKMRLRVRNTEGKKAILVVFQSRRYNFACIINTKMTKTHQLFIGRIKTRGHESCIQQCLYGQCLLIMLCITFVIFNNIIPYICLSIYFFFLVREAAKKSF